jgi:CheY-like chemotaxis protein
MVEVLTILLAEDNPDHVFLTLEGLKRSGITSTVKVVEDGQEVLDYLYRKGKYDDDEKYPIPELILLDIRLPKKSGLDVLKIIKKDEKLKVIPVIMITTSKRGEDVVASYHYGANSYVTKPAKFQDFMSAMTSMYLYWCETNSLPPKKNK